MDKNRYVVTGYRKPTTIGDTFFPASRFTLQYNAKSKKEALVKARKYLDPKHYSPNKPYTPAGVTKLRVYKRKPDYMTNIEQIKWKDL